MTFSIAKQYTDTPGPRYRRQGDFSGEQFREDHLENLFKHYKSSHQAIEIDLDGTFGYPTSFLEEAFGGLARIYPESEVLEAFTFKATEQPSIVEGIKGDIINARKRGNAKADEKGIIMDIEKAFKHTESISKTSKEAIAEIERSFVQTSKHLCDLLPDSREKSLFLTKFQEAKFWAVECVAKN